MTVNIPFDMQRTGAVISRLRKKHSMTQMQLADALGVTFQAVSNWERGLSMPDISKLPELAELFGTTIDELLGRRCPVIEQAAKGLLDEHLQSADVSVEEAAEAAPFLPPEQAEALAAHVLETAAPEAAIDLASLLPFMSTKAVDRIALDRETRSEGIAGYVPFLSDGALMHIFRQRIQRKQSVTTLLPFLPASAIDQLASSFTGE